jgi:transcription elongation factor Elf1
MDDIRQRMRLGDDGSLDTVIVCSDCGWEMRYHYDPSTEEDEDTTDEEAYSDFVDWCLDDAEGEHECPAIVDHHSLLSAR